MARYTLTDEDKKSLKDLPWHFSGKSGEFVRSFCTNLLEADSISVKQLAVLRSLQDQRRKMYHLPQRKKVSKRDWELDSSDGFGYQFESSDYGSGYYDYN